MRNPKVYIDIQIGSKLQGRVIFEIFHDVLEKTSENFRGLCTGEYGTGKATGKFLQYIGCKAYSVVPGKAIKFGDFEHNDGSGGESIYGGPFRAEGFLSRHSQAGVLSMVGTETPKGVFVGSQFLVTLRKCPSFDGKCVAFGQVRYGMDMLRAVERVPTDRAGRPRVPVIITNSGVVPQWEYRQLISGKEGRKRGTDAEEGLRKLLSVVPADVFASEVKPDGDTVSVEDTEREKEPPDIVSEQNKEDELSRELEQTNEEEPGRRDQHALPEDNRGPVIDNDTTLVEDDEKAEVFKRLLDAKMIGQRANGRELKREKEQRSRSEGNRPKDEVSGSGASAAGHSVKRRRKWNAMTNAYLTDTAADFANHDQKWQKKLQNSTFGWDVFNVDSQYRAHEKRVGKILFNEFEYNAQRAALKPEEFYEPSCGTLVQHVASEEAKQRLAKEAERQIAQRAHFSRRRRDMSDALDVDYVNDRNRSYNEKLQRAFGKYSREIKQNLERGTAL